MNIFLTNLAVADLLILLFCLPPTVLNDVTKTFWLSQPFCKSMIFAQVGSFSSQNSAPLYRKQTCLPDFNFPP